MRKAIPTIIIFFALFSFAHADIYKCVDKQGNVTFTTTPGPGCDILGVAGFEKHEMEKAKQPPKVIPRKRATKRKAKKSNYELRLLSWRWKQRYSHVIAEGEVENVSGRELKRVMALVRWYDRRGKLITSHSSLIEYNPLPPNQTSPFRVIETYDPSMKTAIVEFKFMWGRKISTYR